MAINDSNYDSLFKIQYGDGLEEAVPEHVVLAKRIGFKGSVRPGKHYSQAIKLTKCSGFTYQGTSTANSARLSGAVSPVLGDFQLDGSQLVLQEQIHYGVAYTAEDGKQAFTPIMKSTIKEMFSSTHNRIELQLLYGQTNIGAIATSASSGNNAVVTLTTGSWSSGIWSALDNAKVDVYDSTLTTKRNTNALTVAQVRPDTRQFDLSGSATADTEYEPNDVIVPFTSKGNDFAGFDKITTNTGTLFNINAGQYGIWKGSTYDNGGQKLTFADVNAAVELAITRGGMKNLVVIVSPASWADLNADEAGLLRYAKGDSEAKRGFDKITYRSQVEVEILPHGYCKDGEAFVVCLESDVCFRVGQDVTFEFPSPSGKKKIFFDLENEAASEIRNYSRQALAYMRPALSVKITNIVPTKWTQ